MSEEREDDFTVTEAVVCFVGSFLFTYGIIRGAYWLGKRNQK